MADVRLPDNSEQEDSMQNIYFEVLYDSGSRPRASCRDTDAQQVAIALKKQQAMIQQQQVTVKILGDVKHSYFNNLDSLASSIGYEVCGILHLNTVCGLVIGGVYFPVGYKLYVLQYSIRRRFCRIIMLSTRTCHTAALQWQVVSKVSPLLMQASELCSRTACLSSNQEVLHRTMR